jgi:interleukin-1 receptor-associated kinase 1/coatomer subunit beta'
VHKNGEKIAVKMLYDMPGLEKEEFQNEFSNLARLQHPNIVRLVGYCHEVQNKCVEHNGRLVFAERIRKALCFEYMHYGSLDKHLSGMMGLYLYYYIASQGTVYFQFTFMSILFICCYR